MSGEDLRKHLRHNFIANMGDGGFFGFALGFASFVTIIPLFVSQMTSSAALIGLIPAIHAMGWQLPQLLTAGQVSRQRRFKPMVLLMTINERVPFLGLAIVAWLLPVIGAQIGLWVTFLLLIWQGLGAGFTATAWQSLIAKIFPPESRGTFYGAQASIANVFSSLSAVGAGVILDKLASPNDFVTCFVFAAVFLGASYFCLAQTREPESEPAGSVNPQGGTWQNMVRILTTDKNFDWFLVARNLAQFGTMGFAFYTVYAVRKLGMDEITVGILTSVLMASQIVANPLMGWLGDRWSHRLVMGIGLLAAFGSAFVAWFAHDAAWFYAVVILAGIASVGVWTTGLALILEFGKESDRPMYIGLANTLTAPMTFVAPLLGGILADSSGFQATFLATAAGGLLTALVLFFLVRDPRREMYN